MKTPLVSVIIPCYNQGQFLQEAIKSVLNQTYTNWEVIVIDDGSKDNAREIAEGFEEVRYIYQENQGVCAARNRGISHANGEYFVFLDADDQLLANTLEVGVHALENCKDAGMTFGRAYCQDGEGQIVLTSPEVKTCSYADLLRFNCIWHPACAMIRADALATIGNFETSLVNCGDYDIYLRLARTYPIHSNSQFVSTYISSDNSLSKNKLRAFTYMFRVRRAHSRYVRHDHNLTKAYQEGNSFYEDYYGIPLFAKLLDILKSGDFRNPLFRDTLWQFLRYHPRWFLKKSLAHMSTKITGCQQSAQVE